MTLEEQWQEDVKQFGELAYLMWEAGIKTHHDKTSYLSFLNNFSVELLINAKSDIRRKQSAALDFDLVAASAGDEVETRPRNERLDWITVTFIEQCNDTSSIQFWIEYKERKYRAYLSDLRMKHPRRVGVDYSKFED